MAFAIRDLSVLAYANGFTLWHYKGGNDSPRVIRDGENYFADASDMMAEGDMIMISSMDGAALITVAKADTGTVKCAAIVE